MRRILAGSMGLALGLTACPGFAQDVRWQQVGAPAVTLGPPAVALGAPRPAAAGQRIVRAKSDDKSPMPPGPALPGAPPTPLPAPTPLAPPAPQPGAAVPSFVGMPLMPGAPCPNCPPGDGVMVGGPGAGFGGPVDCDPGLAPLPGGAFA